MLFSLSVLAVVAAALVCDTCLSDINGAGSPTPSPMMKQWSFSYSLLKPSVNVEFAPIGGEEGYDAITQPCRKNYQQDFIVSDINFFITKGQASYGVPGKDLGVYPFFAGALVLPYNLPGLDAQLVLTRELIWRIYNRNITKWNDPAFNIPENQSVFSKLKPLNITLVLQGKDVGNVVTIQQMLVNVDGERRNANKSVENPWGGLGANGYYPKTAWGDRFNETNATKDLYPPVIMAKSAFAVVSNVLTIEGALGHAPLAYAVQAGLTYAVVKNRLNQTIDPAVNSNLAAALNYAFISQGKDPSKMQNVYVADNAGNNSYPLTAFYYLVLHKDIAVECDLRREMFKFFNWILTSPAAKAQVEGSDGYALFDTEFLEVILHRLQTVKCQGKELLAKQYKESGQTVVRQAAISLAAICLTIALIILVTLSWKRNNRITKAAGLTFATCFLLGCILNYISIFIWSLIPNTDAVCEGRYIVVSLGYTLLLGAMFAKCWEISKIFTQARSGDISPIQELPWWKFCQVFFSVVGINFLLLIILSSYDPPKTKVTVVDELELIAIHECEVNHTMAWLSLEFIYFSCLIVWGGYLAYQTRDIWEKYNYPNESRSILLSIYNLIFCGVILIPLANYLGKDIEIGFFLIATAILFPTSFALFMVYGPKIISFLGSRHSKGSKGSQAKSRQQSQRTGERTGAQSPKLDGEGAARDTQGGAAEWGLKPREKSKQKDEKRSLIVEEDRGEVDNETHGQTGQKQEMPLTPRGAHDPDGYDSP